MAYVAPTTNILTFDSGSMSIASGTLQIILNTRSVSGFSASGYTMDVVDIGSIEVDYNYVESIGEINDFKINVPTFEFTMMDKVRQVGSPSSVKQFAEVLARIEPYDLIVAKVTFNSKSDYFYTTREQCEFSYKDRKIKLKFQHPLKYGAIGYGKSWSNSTFSAVTADILDNGVGDPEGNPVPAVYPVDLVQKYLEAISDSPDFYYSSELYSSNTTGFGDKRVFVSLLNAGDFPNATIAVKQLALSESAIVGNILGNAFYIPRYQKTFGRSFSADDFEEIGMDYSFRNARYYFFEYELGDQTFGSGTMSKPNVTTISPLLINEVGSSNINVDYGQLTLLYPCEGESWNIGVYPTFGSIYYTSIDNSFESNVIASYRDIFRISGFSYSAGVTISGTILGIDKLLPHEHISITSGVHPLVDGKDFRPSYLKFNLKEDKIEFEAYQF